MDFGFARFLEMFEERFGRIATTAILAILGLAASAWAVKTIIEAIIYVYDLIKSAKLLTVLEEELAASHIIVFAIQIAITFLIIGIVWRMFYLREIRRLEHGLDATETRIRGMLDRVQKETSDFEEKVKALDQREAPLLERMAAIKAKHEEIIAKFGKTPNSPKPPDFENT